MKNPKESIVFVCLAILFGLGAVLGALSAYWSFQARQPLVGSICIIICAMAAIVSGRLFARFKAARAEEPIQPPVPTRESGT